MALDSGESSGLLGRYAVLMIFHAGTELQPVRLPTPLPGTRWYRVLDTSLPDGNDIMAPKDEIVLDPADVYLVNPRTTVVLLARSPAGAG